MNLSQPCWDDPEVDWSVFDACLVRTTWDYMERRDAYVAWARRVGACIPVFNPPGVLAWNTHKSYLAELERHGVPVAPTVWLEPGTTVDVRAVVRDRGWKRGFIKPQVGATARETLRFEVDPVGLASAQEHLDRCLAREGMMLQPYLERVETEGERSAIFFDGELSHTVQKVPVPGDYRVQDDWGASDRPEPFTDDQLALARSIVAQAEAILFPDVSQHLLYARVDFLVDDDGREVLTELELVEPSLFFRHDAGAADRFAAAICRRVEAMS